MYGKKSSEDTIIHRLKNKANLSRLGRTFKTRDNFYYYDTGTGKVFCVDEIKYDIFKKLLSNNNPLELKSFYSQEDIEKEIKEINKSMMEEHILLAPPVLRMEPPDIENILTSNMDLLTIEVTEKCNLRCKYCVYNSSDIAFRTFGNNSISFETVRKAIDSFLTRTSDNQGIGFYGGEPLIEFNLIKKCIKYIKENYSDRKLTLTTTTNCTLVTDEIAEFLIENNFVVVASIDGPESIHNKNRVDINGNGSFEKTMQGFSKLVAAAKHSDKNSLSINMVLDDTSSESFDAIQNFLWNSKEIPEGINVTTSYVTKGSEEIEYEGVDSSREKELLKRAHDLDPLVSWSFTKQNSSNTLTTRDLFSNNNIEKDLTSIHRRLLIDKPAQTYRMNGCCIPGGRSVNSGLESNLTVTPRACMCGTNFASARGSGGSNNCQSCGFNCSNQNNNAGNQHVAYWTHRKS